MDVTRLKTAGEVVSQIRDYRRRLHVSQVELADVVGISQPYLCKIEKGVSQDVPLELIMRILDTLGVIVRLEKPVKKSIVKSKK
jgi:predicted transcriptional regulator